MDNPMEEKSNQAADRPNQRRKFFTQVLAAVGGGIIGGNLLERFLQSRNRNVEKKDRVKVSANPLAVPRSKEGSRSNG